MSTRPSMYYDGYGSYDFPKEFFSIKPLKARLITDGVPPGESQVRER